MAKTIQNRFSLAASGSTLLSTVRATEGNSSASGLPIPEANEWHFTNIGTGTVVATPYFNGVTSHAGYTIPANDSLIIDLAGMNDWKIEETGGAAGAIVTLVGYLKE
jgi:hypothetical protein